LAVAASGELRRGVEVQRGSGGGIDFGGKPARAGGGAAIIVAAVTEKDEKKAHEKQGRGGCEDFAREKGKSLVRETLEGWGAGEKASGEKKKTFRRSNAIIRK